MAGAGPEISDAQSFEDYTAFGEVCRAYVAWCRERYRDIPWLVEEVFGYQALDAELTTLPAKYGPPNGRTLIARIDGRVVGGGAYRRLSGNICELKRLFVTNEARGLGLGRSLTEALFAAGRADGYTGMRLDTGRLMAEAIALYESLGFVRIAPYIAYPDRLMPHLIFMERPL